MRRRRQHKWAWVFNEPVNAEELGCTDYYVIIKNPMDLGTVKKKLEEVCWGVRVCGARARACVLARVRARV